MPCGALVGHTWWDRASWCPRDLFSGQSAGVVAFNRLSSRAEQYAALVGQYTEATLGNVVRCSPFQNHFAYAGNMRPEWASAVAGMRARRARTGRMVAPGWFHSP